MGQVKNERRVKDNEAMAMAKYLRSSPQKLNLVCQTIRGQSAGKALVDLEFNNRRIAQEVRKVLQSAIANAENNHALDVDRLYVSEAFVGKSITMKRFRARARGRGAAILKPFSRLTVIVRERDGDVTAAPKKAEKPAAAKKAPAQKAEGATTEETKKAPAKKAAVKKTAAKKTAAKKEDK